MESKKVYIYTIGCQMNVYDSGRLIHLLHQVGYGECDTPEKADLIIVNTCSIRQKAQDKVFSFLGRVAPLKKENPRLIIAMGGCVAQQEGPNVIKRAPYVDIVFGTHTLFNLPKMLMQFETRKSRIIDTRMGDTIDEHAIKMAQKSPFPKISEVSRFVTIMRGCENFCTYCVVPYVRGKEISRPPAAILAEIQELVAGGVKEVTLLGQNVNSYGQKDGLCSFAELLSRVNAIEGLDRIRFATSHPKDFSDALIDAFHTLDKLCRHLHLPVQSGSDAILKKMNRKYTRAVFVERIKKLRAKCPDIAVTSDMIVGFPGETRENFEETLSLVREIEFDGLFAFAYSDRPNARAAGFSDKLSETEKNERLRELLALQEQYTLKKHQAFLGQSVTILVEGPSKKQVKGSSEKGPTRENRVEQWTGRTPDNKIVNFKLKRSKPDHIPILPGTLLRLTIDKAHSHSLWGVL